MMKTMKKNILAMAVLLMASATFVACSSNDNTIDQQPAQPAGQQVYTMTINAQKGSDAATNRALSLSGSALNATWATTENVYVKKGETWASGSLQPDADAATATLKGTLSGIEINASDVLTLQFPRSGALDYTGQVGTLEDIAAKYDYATATVTVASVSATGNINPTAATTTFENQQAIVKFTLIDKADGTTPLSASQLVINDGTNDYTVTPASATNEIYVAIPGISGQTVTLTATVGSDTYTYEKTGVTFTKGKYYAIAVKMTKAAEDPLATPLTMEALSDGTILVNIGNNIGTLSSGMKYAVNGGEKTTITTTTTINVAAGDKVQFYGNSTSTQEYGNSPEVKLQGTAQTKVYGNIMSLRDEENFATNYTTISGQYVFYGLFKENANLTDASGLQLPATTLAFGCYNSMFQGCTKLTAAPALPATTLASGCYNNMFFGCTNLTAAPVLPATTLAMNCYYYMFYGCTNLNAVTCLATDISAQSCTSFWLYGVSASGTLTTPASTSWTTNSASGIPSGWTRVNAE